MKPSNSSSAPTIYLLLIELLGRLKHELSEISETHSLSLMQAKTLYLLKEGQDIAMSTLSNILHCDASNITGIADRLEAQELVIRKPSKTDRRVTSIVLTPKGSELRIVILDEIAKLEAADLADRLTPEETTTLFQLLTKLK
jgi:DNA-binding MarR family transcriptional regulator